MRRAVSISLIALALWGCQTAAQTGSRPATRTTKATASPKASLNPVVSPPTATTLDTVTLTSKVKTLVGKVKLISNQGGAIISDQGGAIISNNSGSVLSNNSGNIISDQGGGLVSDQGGSILSNNSGSLVSNNGGGYHVFGNPQGYGLLATGSRRIEALLAEATIALLDAAGKRYVDATGKPIGGVSDAQGQFRLAIPVPENGAILQVTLHQGGTLSGGTLSALLVPDPTGETTRVDIDTASSLAASYVLDRYVKGDNAVLAKLPRTAERALQRDMITALELLPPGPPAYDAAKLAELAQGLRDKAPGLDTSLKRVESVLVAGQSNLGEGLPATQVALTNPATALIDSIGELLVAEAGGARIRRVRSDGTMELLAGGGFKGGDVTGQLASEVTFGTLTDMAAAPDGSVLIAETLQNRVYRLGADGRLGLLAGNGVGAPAGIPGNVEVPAAETSLAGLSSLACGPDGTVYIGEVPRSQGSGPGRLLRISPDGVIHLVPITESFWQNAAIAGLTVGLDGTLYAINGSKNTKVLAALAPGATTWTALATDRKFNQTSRVYAARDGSGDVFVSETDSGVVLRIPKSGTPMVVAGNGINGYSGDGGPATSAALNHPAGVSLAPDGTLYIADRGNGVIRAVKHGVIRTVAGTQGGVTEGDASRIAVNAPTGLAFDADGNLLVSELAGNAVKRLVNGRLTLVAGTGEGYEGEGGPAINAQLYAPGAIARGKDGLYILEKGNQRLSLIDPAGNLKVVAGDRTPGELNTVTQSATTPLFRDALALTVGPDDRPYWTDSGNHQVARLNADGTAELIAGGLKTSKEGGVAASEGTPAVSTPLSRPYGLAFDSAGDLYIADTANLQIRKVSMKLPDRPMSLVAGAGRLPFLGAIATSPTLPDEEGKPAREALLAIPIALAFDANDNLYVAEAGTLNLESLAGLAGLSLGDVPFIGARVRRIDLKTPNAPIRTIAGFGGKVLANKLGDDALQQPLGLAIDPQGRLIIADTKFNQIKIVPKAVLESP